MLRIGFDVDGVLADFVSAYQRLIVKTAGVDLFKPGDMANPPCWDWVGYRGYSAEVVSRARATIRESDDFWLNLSRLSDCFLLRDYIKGLERQHELYFITSRAGGRVKRQTELWLFEQLAYPVLVPSVWPTVCIVGSRAKGAMAKALRLDVYVDDNYDNVNDVAEQSDVQSDIRTYLVNRSYNTNGECVNAPALHPAVRRVSGLGELFAFEGIEPSHTRPLTV